MSYQETAERLLRKRLSDVFNEVDVSMQDPEVVEIDILDDVGEEIVRFHLTKVMNCQVEYINTFEDSVEVRAIV